MADSPGSQSEQVVHGVGVIPQTIRLLQQLEGWHAQSLMEEEAIVFRVTGEFIWSTDEDI